MMKLIAAPAIIVALLALLVQACATPPGQLTEADFAWSRARVSATPADVHRRLLHGFRRCGATFGFLECVPPENDGSVLCDVFLSGPYGGRSDYVLGRIIVSPADARGSDVSLGVQPIYERGQGWRQAWVAFVNGDDPCRP